MSLAIGIQMAPSSPEAIDFVREAERLGADSVWVPEFWGYDALTPIGALAMVTDRIRLGTGIVQLGARTPAMLAMSALSLQALSGGRFHLGIGTSGPQVMEGWHGVEFKYPIQRTRETIEIVRKVASGERLVHDGSFYQLPLPQGEGKALRAAVAPAEIPIYIASLGPANLALTGELADGWIGNSFFPETASVFFDAIGAGARGAGRSLSDIDLTVSAACEFTDDVDEAGRRHAGGYAFTFGAMGSSSTNFYNEAFTRQGFGEDVADVQRLWREGRQDEARERVPIEIGLGTNLIGPPDEIRRRLRDYHDCGVNTLRINPVGDTLDEQLATLGLLLDIVGDVNDGA